MDNSIDNFKKRASRLLWCILIWAILASCWLFYYSVFARQKYIELGNKIAVRQGVYYAGRGSLIDEGGKKFVISFGVTCATFLVVAENKYCAVFHSPFVPSGCPCPAFN